MSQRLIGALLLLAAALCAWIGVWQPLQQARAGAGSITLHGGVKLAFLVPACIVFGLGYLLGGSRFDRAVSNHDPDKARRWGRTSGTGWLLFLASAAAAFGLHRWTQHSLADLGYVYGGR